MSKPFEVNGVLCSRPSKTIFVAKVYENLSNTMNNHGRNVGWTETFEQCEQMLADFGDECRWFYAIIEESCPGMHGPTKNAWWYKYIDTSAGSLWVEIPPNEFRNDFMRCVNHTIG